jgi:flagellar biosynthetic protein FlhB
LLLLGVLLGLLFIATVAVTIAQVGFHLNPDRLGVDWDRFSWFDFSRFLSWSKVVRGLVMLLKLAAVIAVAWWILRERGPEIGNVGEGGLAGAVGRSWGIIIKLALGLAGTLLLIGFIDYAYQRWRFEQSLYMTRQEMKDELKREEGDPQIKARIRRMQREVAQRKMYQQVPKATVVITNPTHLAIALEYQPGQMGAPKVIAKGAGHIAKRIVELARQHGVPVIERKPLAQALYRLVKLDREIPLAFYVLVAELLAYVYRLKGGGPS